MRNVKQTTRFNGGMFFLVQFYFSYLLIAIRAYIDTFREKWIAST